MPLTIVDVQGCGRGGRRGRGRGRGRGRVRGRGRGRGCGRGRSSEIGRGSGVVETSGLSVAAPQELIDCKQAVQLHRVVLPDAPPRKRRAMSPSPEPIACVFMEPSTIKEESYKVEPTDNWHNSGQVPEDVIKEEVMDPVAEEDDYEESSLPTLSEHGQLHDEEPTTSLGIGSNDLVIERWLNNNSDDEDLDVDKTQGIAFSVFSPTATDQPADDSGLTSAEAELLRREAEASDNYVREIAPTYYCDFDWTNSRDTFTGKREAFTGTSGPTFSMTDMTKPVDIFYKMFDTTFIDTIVTETNRYADQALTRLTNDPSAAKFSRTLRWKPTKRDEMVTYLAVVLLQGLYPKVREEAYFAFDGFGTTPYFASIMSYNRYHLLKTFQHFIDNETAADRTKLNKIRPVIDYLNDKFSSLYMPRQEIAIDESLLKWHGRLSFSQKISSKAAKVGVKTYELCESCSGYLWQFRVYTGKDGPHITDRPDSSQNDRLDEDIPEDTEHTDNTTTRPTHATANIVYDLMRPLLHRGHTLIMDNFYNSPLLARCLKRDGQTDVFGTLRLNREFVPDSIKTITKTNMRQGEIVVTYCSDLAVMLWRDSNLVSMISTYHPLQIDAIEKHNRVTYKPAIVLDYNKSMGGIDRKDQFLASQPLERQRNKIWYKKLFRRLYNAAVFNCFVIFTSNNQNNGLSHRQFRTVLAEDLLKTHRRVDLLTEPRLLRRKPVMTSVAETSAETSTTATLTTASTSTHLKITSAGGRPCIAENHFPMKSSSKYTRCWMCTRNGKPTRTRYKCEACNVNLCIFGCFKAYHKP